MRMFFITVGVLSWIWALAVLWIFAENGGVQTVTAAGVFAIVAMVAFGCERILNTLEEIRDGSVTQIRVSKPGAADTEVEVAQRPVGTSTVIERPA